MKLPTWRGETAPVEREKKNPARMPGRHLCGPAPSGWGGYSVAAAAIVVVIAVVANLLVNALPAGATQFDISAGSMFTMSQETEQLLDGLDQDITVYWLVQSGQEDETLGTLLDRYTSRSDRVTPGKTGPGRGPQFCPGVCDGDGLQQQPDCESEARYTYVSYEDIYTYEYGDDGASYYMNFAGESALTSAIDYVIRDTLPKLVHAHRAWGVRPQRQLPVRGGKAEYGTGGALPAHGGRGARRRGLPADLWAGE